MDVSNNRVLVIGSGPSGAMAAHELIRLGVPVTMLESGYSDPQGFLLRLGGRNLFRQKPEGGMREGPLHEATGDPKTQWYYNLSPGGLSNNWTGAVPRFAPEDFSEGERLHDKYRWPIDYETLAPFYERAERLMAVTAERKEQPNLPMGFSDHGATLPADWHAVVQTAVRHGQGFTVLPLADGPPFMVVRRGTAFNSFANIIRPLLRSPQFELLSGAHALRLTYNPATGRVSGVIYHDRATRTEKRISAVAVVVACGPLNSAKLLFDSANETFPEGLGNTHDVLGRYLHDHPREWWPVVLERPLSPLAPSGYLTRKPHATSDPLLATSWTVGTVTLLDKLRSFTPLKTTLFGVQVFGTMVPKEKYYVKPHAAQKDEFGQPILDIHLKFAPNELANMVDARQHFLDLMAEAGFPGTIPGVEPQLHPGTAVHYGGVVRMHANPRYGMLDEWNRLHAVSNVYVTDASSFTTGSEKNPTLTAMALSARAAHHLAEVYKTDLPYPQTNHLAAR